MSHKETVIHYGEHTVTVPATEVAWSPALVLATPYASSGRFWRYWGHAFRSRLADGGKFYTIDTWTDTGWVMVAEIPVDHPRFESDAIESAARIILDGPDD